MSETRSMTSLRPIGFALATGIILLSGCTAIRYNEVSLETEPVLELNCGCSGGPLPHQAYHLGKTHSSQPPMILPHSKFHPVPTHPVFAPMHVSYEVTKSEEKQSPAESPYPADRPQTIPEEVNERSEEPQQLPKDLRVASPLADPESWQDGWRPRTAKDRLMKIR